MSRQSVPLEEFLNSFLQDPERAHAYLDGAFQRTDEPDFELRICQAIRDVIRAQSFAKVAKRAKVGRESLYKSFADHADPRMSTLLKVLHSMGYGVSLTPLAVPSGAERSPKRRLSKARPRTASASSSSGRRTKQRAASR